MRQTPVLADRGHIAQSIIVVLRGKAHRSKSAECAAQRRRNNKRSSRPRSWRGDRLTWAGRCGNGGSLRVSVANDVKWLQRPRNGHFAKPCDHATIWALIETKSGASPTAPSCYSRSSPSDTRGSTIVTANLPFEDRTQVLGSERLTGARPLAHLPATHAARQFLWRNCHSWPSECRTWVSGRGMDADVGRKVHRTAPCNYCSSMPADN